MLFEEIQTTLEGLRSVGLADQFAVPTYITDNLKYPLYDWQRQSLENFLFNEKKRENSNIATPNHLMFNMATGSGKTLVMAALILYYYKHGYRNFIFFVNQNTIVGKTQDNFINRNHQKYLFKENIKIDGQVVNIREVEQFSVGNDIQIKFTTIHKLHNDIHRESEDSLLLSDLQRRDIILIGDEAHHLNTTTIRNQQTSLTDENISFDTELTGRSSENDVERSWETTVCHNILNRAGKTEQCNRNALLEFTATIPNNVVVQQKYADKIITQFDIKDFIRAGCTKQIKLVRSNLSDRERVLQALLLNWYRYRLALELEIPNFKPVILFRNKTIEESQRDYYNFLSLVSTLTPNDFDFLRYLQHSQDSLADETPEPNKERGIIFWRILAYMHSCKLTFHNVVAYIKANFGERNCIITNSRTNTNKTEKTDAAIDNLLNSLESPANHIRAIFTVQRLTEGWDVLNLFDIVRLNHGRDTDYKRGKIGKSTTSEVQLIGRGIRYCPFKFGEKDSRRRKFDNDISNKYRILEEFYFHSNNDERYISELSQALKREKLLDDTRTKKTFSIKQNLRNEFNELYLFVNERKENENRRLRELPTDFVNLTFEHNIECDSSEERVLNIYSNIDTVTDPQEQSYSTSGIDSFRAFEQHGYSRHIFYKAVHRLNAHAGSYFSFENLRKRLHITSLDNLFDFLSSIRIDLTHNYKHIADIPPKKWLIFTEKFLLFCQKELEQYDKPFIGTEFSLKPFKDCFPFTKEKLIEQTVIDENSGFEARIQGYDWYALDAFCGTEEERNLIMFINENLNNLREKYSKVCLLRNEEVYKIFSFDTGEGFCPDYLLLLANKKGNLRSYYQIFIEPKGKYLAENDRWKEIFLEEISRKYGLNNSAQIVSTAIARNYYLIGLPFFNKTDNEMKTCFETAFDTIITPA